MLTEISFYYSDYLFGWVQMCASYWWVSFLISLLVMGLLADLFALLALISLMWAISKHNCVIESSIFLIIREFSYTYSMLAYIIEGANAYSSSIFLISIYCIPYESIFKLFPPNIITHSNNNVNNFNDKMIEIVKYELSIICTSCTNWHFPNKWA